MQIFMRCLTVCLLSKLTVVLLNVMKRMHSKTCLPENVCKFLFDCYAYAYVASDSMVVGVRCTGKVRWRGIAKLNLLIES
ncbi:hypothetical protein T11_13666 [Trichinella zimbabwensis]|uniref:Secreted protein n=1 Tax=Trichinella zimbabwensis TaxID=268475 RepID=A0A0V1HE33_9BILA|nr:hypothetical protein T11_13666 [Trichinella zimbabwensis]